MKTADLKYYKTVWETQTSSVILTHELGDLLQEVETEREEIIALIDDMIKPLEVLEEKYLNDKFDDMYKVYSFARETLNKLKEGIANKEIKK